MILRRILGAVLVLAWVCFPARAGAQDQTSKNYTLPVGHTVTLAWTASVSTGVTSYNVYVSSVSGGPYTAIGSSTTLQFDDLNAVSGVTYFYVVTAVDPINGESGYSNEVSVTIPVP